MAAVKCTQTKNTLLWSATFGLRPGYSSAPAGPEELLALEQRAVLCWQGSMRAVHQKRGILVTAVSHSSRAVYSLDHGCPPDGEPTITFSGAWNGLYCDNRDDYESALRQVVWLVMEELQQTTVSLCLHSGGLFYLQRSPEGA